MQVTFPSPRPGRPTRRLAPLPAAILALALAACNQQGQALTEGIEARGFGLQLGQARSHRIQFALGGVTAERGGVLAASRIDHSHHTRAAAHTRDHEAGRSQPGLAANEAPRMGESAARML